VTAAAILDRCRAAGVSQTAAGEALRFRAAGGDIPADLRAALVAHKPDLLATLRAVCGACGRPVHDPRRCCYRCEDMPCSRCGRMTGSHLRSLCDPCGAADPG
jgi:hypothetical protein